jgi:hypothetical protein
MKFNTPVFDYEKSYPDNYITWAGHKYFTYDRSSFVQF